MASEDDGDDAQQIEKDRKLALELQVEENIGFAVGQRQEVIEENSTFDEASITTTEAALGDERAPFRTTNQEARMQDDEYGEISSASAVAGVASLESRGEEQEDDFDNDDFQLVSPQNSSDMSSGVLLSDEDKKPHRPVFVSNQDADSSGKRSSDVSSSYAAAASSAQSESYKQLDSDGVGVISSVTHLRQESSTTKGESHTELARTQVRRGDRQEYFYDIRDKEVGDQIFQALFGEYGDIDPLLVNVKPRYKNSLATNPTARMEAARSMTLEDSVSDPKLQLEQYCSRFGNNVNPLYQRYDLTGPIRDRTFETELQHPLWESTVIVGKGKTQLESEIDAARRALASLLNSTQVADRAKDLTISFRAAAAKLPFCLRFQLERSILSDAPERIPLKMKRANDSAKSHLIYSARALMLVYIRVILPSLLTIDWSSECEGENTFTLIELFAEELWDALGEVKQAIKMGRQVNFEGRVQELLRRARLTLRHAEKVCDTTETKLSSNGEMGQDGYVRTIRKRSLWPVAMYSCKFDFDGNLVPTDFQVSNKDIPKVKFVQPQTRRAMREAGWSVRDRFVIISSVKFHQIFLEKLADWLEQNPRLCNREYEFLFDKGTGKPTIWMYSPPKGGTDLSLSRNSLLESLGCFRDVAATKIGDRISLAFTQTTPIDEIPLDCIVAEPELVRNGYQYSDGCGVMGPGIARKVQEALKLQEVPGAIQIRMGGVKGMLSYRHDYPENKIGIRPSMVKFRSNHRMLEVKQHAYINEHPPIFSQLILIMHYQGVPNRVLLGLQAKACAEMAQEYDNTAGDVDDNVQYIQQVVKHGRKQNGCPFSPHEFEELRRTMTESKTRVNLRCGVVLMYGVIDEHGVLEEGQVLIGNGMIQGPVLVSRSPCLMPGDIQKVIAVPGSNELDKFVQTYSKLRDVIVFSSKGSRPLADCLGGGDLDGDQFYIIYEKDIVDNMSSADAHDYGSQSVDVNITVDVQDCFRVVYPYLPAIEGQLEVLRKLLNLGDIVSWSSDAWIRVADIEGPGSDRAISMADLCQHALDARKLAILIDDSQIRTMIQIRRELEAPHWRSGGENCRQSNSILGILYTIWDSWIRDLEAASRRRLRDYRGYHGVDASLDESESQVETDTVVSTVNECIMCVAPGIMQCLLCGGNVWFCSDQCKRWHESEAGHTRGSVETYNASTIESFSMSGDSSILMYRPMEVLLDVIFGRKRPSFTGDKAIDFRSLTETDLLSLSEMVLMEFLECMMLEQDIKRSRASNESPRVNDVFRMHGGELAICRRPSGGGDLAWFDKDNKPMHSTAMPYQRVASMSGTLRVLESLLSKPAAGSLMEQAMKRKVVQVAAAEETIELGSSNTEYLNESQRRVVKTVLRMNSGIICVQGPPGCGKSSTLVEIVCAIGRGIIVSAPSNAAVANLALKILSTGQFSTEEVVVWGENCEASVRFLNPAHRHRRWTNFRRDYFNLGDKQEAEKSKMRHKFASWLQMDGATIAKMASLARIDASDSSYDGLKIAASAKVLLCTLNTAGSTRLRNAVKHKFDLMLLDEGSQAPEAEFYIATTFPGVRRIVVVGDPMQLPATVSHEGCEQAGYGDSFLSHILKFQPEKVHLLDVQYRMEPEILAFSNKMFYSDRIRSDESVLDRKPRLKLPFAVVDTSGFGRDVEQPVHSSWKNECEANVIKSILCNDEDVRRVQSSVVGVRTIVITPYKAQQRFLQEELKKLKTLHRHDISTVDSFQGQEGDIVIVSTVRTKHSVGFTDNPNRLNVALTRGKRVVRVIGNLEFFNEVTGEASVLRSLAAFAQKEDIVQATTVSTAWKPPDWTMPTAWKPTMTARFHECLKPANMKRMDKNVAFNTLLTVCIPRLSDLTNPPTEYGSPRWQTSSLRKYDERLQIVWIAKELEQSGANGVAPYKGVVEAHFSGKRGDCLNFIQKNFLVPRNACRVKRDMSAIIPSENEVATHSTDIELSWEVTNDIQEAVMDDIIEELPLGLFVLDEYQESILALSPPLLIESRSGMGKTEILFKHSISYYPSGQNSRTCFVTVSANLCRSLQRRYNDVQEVKDVVLPSVSFFSFLGSRVQTETGTETVRSLVSVLLGIYRIPETEMSVSSSCSFWEYVRSKTSHEKSEVDLTLAENEIGGVILGSLAAAVNQKALSRTEYLEEQRSNVPKDTEVGLKTRGMIYDEFVRYRQWKISNDMYDTGDIVLRLVREASEQGVKEIFHSVYLDEVQDFSYAALYLICSIAGKAEGRWVAAGDTAQMISPGCSFTFKGLKDTLLAIRHDIELRKEVRLKRNYRMNRGTLEMANAVIRVIKQYFPKAIESYQKEEAVKDLGLKVALLDWEKATEAEHPSFGVEQALIYGSDVDLEAVHTSMNEWLNNHPFILSSLDSKGLEFDDVIVAFNFERKTWDVEQRRTASLRMCRELYVAVTRARRRVVILMKRDVNTMSTFFQSLNYTFEEADAEVVLQEFQKQTTTTEWFERGMQLFKEEQYKIAASCFKAAQDFGYSAYADGCQLLADRSFEEARGVLRTSSELFFQNGEFKECLDVFTKIVEIKLPWDNADNEILDAALKELPAYLPREQTVRFALVRGSWNVVSVRDLADYSHLFRESRRNSNLIKLVRECSESERREIEGGLPLVVADFHASKDSFADATRLFLLGGDYDSAIGSTEAAIRNANRDLPRIARFWRQNDNARSKLLDKHPVSLLVLLFDSPREAATNHPNDCMKFLGPSIIKLAIDGMEASGVEELHMFSRNAFKADILDALTKRYQGNLINVVNWFRERNDKDSAVQFVRSNLRTWDDEVLLGVILKDRGLRPSGLISELARRDILVDSVRQCLSGESFDLNFAKAASDMALESVKSVSRNADAILAVWKMRRNDARVAPFLREETGSSSTALLYLLFDDPERAGQRRPLAKKCMRIFGEDIVRRAVLQKKGSDKYGAYDILCTFDTNKFARDKPVEFKVGDRIVVTGLKHEKWKRLNGQPGVVKSLKKKTRGSYLVVLDSDKPGAEKRSLKGANLVKESHSSAKTNVASRNGGTKANTSKKSVPNSANVEQPRTSRKQKPRGAKKPSRERQQQDADADDSSMPTLVQEGHKSSSSDDDSTEDSPSESEAEAEVSEDEVSDGMPGLESKQSSAESSDSQAAPRSKKGKSAAVPTHIFTERQEASSSSSDESVPQLQKRAPRRGDDSSSSGSDDSVLSEVPGLLSGENSSDDSSEGHLEPARNEEVSSLPSLEAPRGVNSSHSSSDSSNRPPVLVSRPEIQDSSDSNSDEGEDDVPALMERDGRIANTRARAQAEPPSQPRPSQQPSMPPRNASGARKKKGKKKGRRGGRGGGRGKK